MTLSWTFSISDTEGHFEGKVNQQKGQVPTINNERGIRNFPCQILRPDPSLAVCEVAPKRAIFNNPRHPYTRLLLDTIPDLSLQKRGRQPMEGEVPNPINPPPGCAFHPRCPDVYERCRTEAPVLVKSGDSYVACHKAE